MSIVDDVMKSRISLHGLGFIQVQMEGNQRLHVWHPELPRRSCFEHSAIHDHRFTFMSIVLTGQLRNVNFRAETNPNGVYQTYIHEGPRTPNGGRPWVPDGRVDLYPVSDQTFCEGQVYKMPAYVYHRSEPAGDGRVATTIVKLVEHPKGAHSTCPWALHPDDDFDRFQISEDDLWEIVMDVVGCTKAEPYR